MSAGTPRPLEHDPDRLRELAEELLSRPPYSEHEPTLLERGFELLGELLDAVLGPVLSAVGGSSLIAWIVAVVGLLGLGAVVFVATRRLTSGRGATPVAPPTRGRTAADWHADADAHAAAGDLRAALRCRYIAVVAALAEQDVLDEVTGRTVRELDAEVARAAPTLAEPIADAGECLERVVYGGEPVTEADLAVVDAAARLVAGERRGTRVDAAVGAT